MKILKILLPFCLAVCSYFTGNSQAHPAPNHIDSICSHIDSIIGSKSFERFYFDLNQPTISIGYRLHYVDTANKLFKKIFYKSDIDTSLKTFYFRKDTLIQINLEKNYGTHQSAKYQFNDTTMLSSRDPYRIVKDPGRLAAEGKRYYRLVRYSKYMY